jgi:uncharacterized membrane protein YtjA (UPF0391 family)
MTPRTHYPAKPFTPVGQSSPCRRYRGSCREIRMLKWAIIFAIVSLVTGWLGFYSVSGITGTIAKVQFAIFLILFLIALLAAIGLFHIA